MTTSAPDDENPLLVAWQEAVGDPAEDVLRDRAIARFAFAVPDDGALEAIATASPRGVVEIGAGTGYWARLLHENGVDVVAYDIAPAPSPERRWFADTPGWFPVRSGDHTAVDAHGDRTLLLVWPTRNEDWAADTVQRFAAAGGTTLAYVGEPPGGRTGDDRFHALIGEIDRCLACAYNITTAPCVCGTTPLYARIETIELPHWTGYEDDLRLYVRDHDRRPLAPGRPRSRRWPMRRRTSRP
jgi:hypothetical protein